MPRFTEVNDVIFTEDNLDVAVIGDLHVRAMTQNTNLADVKKEAAAEVKGLAATVSSITSTRRRPITR